jgi:hypothetical protein
MQYILGIDTWEGSPNLDEVTLKSAGVEFVIVRLNDMSGGHHRDTNFNTQWAQAAPFYRWPYFVYNPWATGEANYTWLAANMPGDAHAVSIDIEVRKAGYTPAEYTRQVNKFLALAYPHWNIDIYTGGGYKTLLSQWPTDYAYWWARWPYLLYPDERENWTWDRLKNVLNEMTWIPGATPGPCHLWQVTGDRLIFPGCGGTCVDINAWSGTLAQLADWTGGTPPPPPPLTLEQRVSNIEGWIARHG